MTVAWARMALVEMKINEGIGHTFERLLLNCMWVGARENV